MKREGSSFSLVPPRVLPPCAPLFPRLLHFFRVSTFRSNGSATMRVLRCWIPGWKIFSIPVCSRVVDRSKSCLTFLSFLRALPSFRFDRFGLFDDQHGPALAISQSNSPSIRRLEGHVYNIYDRTRS